MFKPNQYSKAQAIYIAVLGIAWSAYAYSRGVVMSPDSKSYSRWADILIQYNFNILEFLDNVHFSIPPHFYINWVTITASHKVLLGENWELGIVVLNLMAGVFAALLLLKSLWTITGKPACTLFAGLFLLLCHDYYLWIPYVLSDTIFSLFSFLLFILAISLYRQPKELTKRVIGIAAIIFFILFFRPTWPPLLIFVFLSLLLATLFNSIATDSEKRHKLIIRCTLLVCILIPTVIICHSYFMQHPDKWPFPFLSSVVSFLSQDYQKGIVIYARPETYHSLPGNIFEYAYISFHKIIAFFYIDVASYSFIHAVINYIFFVPIYGLSIFAVAQLFKKGNGPSPSNWWSIFSCVLFISLFAFFHSLHQIDYDFRYRVPCLLPLIFLATLGLNELINSYSKKT